MLLRTAIGWHFLNEGLEKLNPPDEKPFSAEGYLRGAVGPFASWYRSQIPDVNGLARLDRDESGLPGRLKAGWAKKLDRIAEHYHFTPDQREKAEESLAEASKTADAWFLDLENAEKIKKYYADLYRVIQIERDPQALAFEKERAYKDRKDLNKTRLELTEPIDAWSEALEGSWMKLVTDEQQARYGDLPHEMTTLDWVNLSTKWGLTFIGIGLLLGFLTPLAALGGAAFLGMVYFSMPPWPGLPPAPVAEGHYWIVNKNLIEMLACLVLASTPNGLWIGLDALLFGWIGRGRGASGHPAATEPPGSNPAVSHPDRPRGAADPRSPITLSRSDR